MDLGGCVLKESYEKKYLHQNQGTPERQMLSIFLRCIIPNQIY